MNTILVVMADPNDRETTRNLIEVQGWNARAVETGEQALKILSAEQPKIILTNLMLRDMSGMDLLCDLYRRYPKVIAIVITKYYSIEGAVEVMRLGAYDYLPSESKAEDLVDSLRRALAASRITDTKERFRRA